MSEHVPTESEKYFKRKASEVATQPIEEEEDLCTYCGQAPPDDCGCSAQDARREEDDEAPSVESSHRMGKQRKRQPLSASKGPAYRQVVAEGSAASEGGEEDEAPEDEMPPIDVNELPDLHQYFQNYPTVSDENVISMCRAYASYLASLSKKKLAQSSCLPKRRRKSYK